MRLQKLFHFTCKAFRFCRWRENALARCQPYQSKVRGREACCAIGRLWAAPIQRYRARGRQRIVANAREAEEDWGRKGLAAMREVVIVALAAFLIAIMVTALLVHFLP